MPTMVKSQVREPFRCVKMLLVIGTRSPTFQPHFLRHRLADQRAGALAQERLPRLGRN